ncbi:MAG: hypothetical protein UY47_C0006G0010 [Parcubacteria group bacterium GW2011_GWB1_49_7]|uniref:HIT domain-containing protein n=1 Tax=Candidatus Zambryskibacteria bacterium RIFCSPHIGHO2_01_FULL_46_25 TaxID=1802738 RepID=A0A1G2T114_9BACT|nr:MAG: hypothetical protein UY47_C0006G0010 [Parcubacteria group bacterium GW2011_GWB1_49_7]OHA90822.1 MAG: hypothetical protein A2838_03420 [Candidatus Zambryskibacteria bacterium RIFCSPHIGHO2_01_FULL_46_25]OHB00777.1 MAG: hypothetical protein A3F53_00250 [Candidatus Zambryskibacteria bacterium RIFCSPHIGHO2_12_FULL_48_10]OHB07112.1 MAG: hypothetical protein A3A31_00070 [Candidatus Zambryskibacteria bacterium RIFCSPLOWO2_01_FULL_48_25]
MSEATLVIDGITDSGTLACIARARTYKQYCQMVRDALAGRCPFCEPDPEVNKVVAQNTLWRAWQSPFPEKNTLYHFIVVPKQHHVDTQQLNAGEKLGLFDILKGLRDAYCYQSRGILIRDGDATLSAGTIQHLHVHVMVPDGKGRVESPFYKGADEEEAGIRRAVIYEKLRQGTLVDDLSPDEKELVKGRI